MFDDFYWIWGRSEIIIIIKNQKILLCQSSVFYNLHMLDNWNFNWDMLNNGNMSV